MLVFTVYRRIYNIIKDNGPLVRIACIDSIGVITVSLYKFCNFVAYWITMSYQYKQKRSGIASSDINQNEMQAISQNDDSD